MKVSSRPHGPVSVIPPSQRIQRREGLRLLCFTSLPASGLVSQSN
ncbi:hypothetical protein RISK_000842 [Rhodopirellula islandica]|uniref:Uncharacterized protein n=1 Tax=Rhodopirellula islandica TaxID=595434 RepID=A0A0J1BKH8_RHOIS|nr:hypothetical protein RISK_000842 [Rhodopirellula islandica]